MTGSNDQDRRIAAWFEDVPSRAPERTIDAILSHARTHPRRRDPLAALRRDPMGSGGSGLGRMIAATAPGRRARPVAGSGCGGRRGRWLVPE